MQGELVSDATPRAEAAFGTLQNLEVEKFRREFFQICGIRKEIEDLGAGFFDELFAATISVSAFSSVG